MAHVLTEKEDSYILAALTWTPEGKRKAGRPKTTWLKEKERHELGGKTWIEMKQVAKELEKEQCSLLGHRVGRG